MSDEMYQSTESGCLSPLLGPDGFISKERAADLLNSQAEQIERLEALRHEIDNMFAEGHMNASVFIRVRELCAHCTPKTKAELLDELLDAADNCIRSNNWDIGTKAYGDYVEAYKAAKAAYETAQGGQ